ncbi:bifunctional adenosylcobinamide kinase/adenosylcobinamide-phosphate guanylyltransferase [Nonomuraea sp. NPDC002799]
MKVLLSGTAGGAGWPRPGCGCLSCAGLPSGHRRPFEAIVDGVVRLPSADPPPGITDGVVRHPSADPPPGITDGVVRHPSADPPPGYAVCAGGLGLTCPGGSAVLHLPAGRPLPVDGPARYDVVLIDLLDRPERLGELRRAGLADDATLVVAVGLDHRVRSEAELARRLRLWGAVAVPDGTELQTAPGRPGPGGTGGHVRRALLLGGSRSGKSAEAELRLAGEPHVTYVATGPDGAGDGEWAERVRAHRRRRPAHWATLETTAGTRPETRPETTPGTMPMATPGAAEKITAGGADLAEVIRSATTPLLIDGLGTWLTAVFDAHGAWEGDRTPVADRCDELVAAWRQAPGPIVAVSDEVGMGVVPATASGRAFRDALGRLNERLAAESEYVALVVAGRLLEL